jgi:hypothetical protein
MRDQETYAINDLIDGVIKKNRSGEYLFDYSNNSFEDTLQDYCEIKLRHNDCIEFLTESSKTDDFRILSARVVGRGLSEDQEDLGYLISDMACEYYREEFLTDIDARCNYNFLTDKLDAGLEESFDHDNGEVRYVGIRRSL